VVLVDAQAAELVEADIPHPQHAGPAAGDEVEDPAEGRLDAERPVRPGFLGEVQVAGAGPDDRVVDQVADIRGRPFVEHDGGLMQLVTNVQGAGRRLHDSRGATAVVHLGAGAAAYLQIARRRYQAEGHGVVALRHVIVDQEVVVRDLADRGAETRRRCRRRDRIGRG
jgi:hypothetical protein